MVNVARGRVERDGSWTHGGSTSGVSRTSSSVRRLVRPRKQSAGMSVSLLPICSGMERV